MKERKNSYIGKAALCLILLLVALPGYSQISFKAHEKHDREMRKSLREAEQADLAFKDTHLNTKAYTFRKGVAARKQLKQAERSSYQFSEKGKPVRWTKIFRKRKHKRERTLN